MVQAAGYRNFSVHIHTIKHGHKTDVFTVVLFGSVASLHVNMIKYGKKKKKKPPALPYLKISCYSNTTIFFFLALHRWNKFWTMISHFKNSLSTYISDFKYKWWVLICFCLYLSISYLFRPIYWPVFILCYNFITPSFTLTLPPFGIDLNIFDGQICCKEISSAYTTISIYVAKYLHVHGT